MLISTQEKNILIETISSSLTSKCFVIMSETIYGALLTA